MTRRRLRPPPRPLLHPLLLGALAPFAIAACGKPPDPLAGRWDVSDPALTARAGVAYAEFKDGVRTVETRLLVRGLGTVSVHQEGAYALQGDTLTITNRATEIDVSRLDPPLRAQAEGILRRSVGGEDGQPVAYAFKNAGPDRLELTRPDRKVVLTRAVGR